MELRTARGLSQYKLAELLGFSRGQISNYEQGSRQPDHATLQQFADFFAVSVDFLLGRTEVRETSGEYSLPPELEVAFRGKRWDQLKPETRRVIASVIRQIDAELETEDKKEKNGERSNE